MKSIVTGSSGFIGKRLIILLKKEHYQITRILRKNLSDSKNDILCDLEKESLKDGVFHNIDTVFHLAAHVHDISPKKKSLAPYKRLNVDATKKIAYQASREGVKNFIYVSSVKASYQKSFFENAVTKKNIYGRTKREAELELLELSSKTDMKICIIRPALVYGPELKGNLLNMKKTIERGWFPPLPKVNNSRSMIHVDDLARAILLIEKKGESGEIYNVTDGKSYSSNEIYEIFCKFFNKKPPKIRLPLFILKLTAYFPGIIGEMVKRLLENDIHSNSKVKSLGFNAKLEFKNLNETLF